ncbi:MAG: biotin/lipoyl-binding protein [Bacteroidales bacterium]|nr:biotin/lipoyl-binding protein [Bacteroidales bacterium]MCF8338779.1 biotin/lipoyl-binding protein [Bacteroidales bacterium]
MKKFSFTINGNQYDVEIKEVEDNIAQLEVNGTTYEVEIHQDVKKSKTPTLVRSEVPTKRQDSKIKKNISTTANVVKAPLPGNIIDILVSEGDEVKKGQKVLTYEAMKMENEVHAEKDGVVKSIKVAKGDSVLEGQELMEIA